MKSLVNWPSNNNQKIPAYENSEIDVFKVITDYFTKASSPLSTFVLYPLLSESFIRAEAADLGFRKERNDACMNEELNKGPSGNNSDLSTQRLASLEKSQRKRSTTRNSSFSLSGLKYM